ncbi:hypothetical protein WEB32_28410 [Streptomyces netropsis]|uniref:DUF1648 domain-containing protein n=1 Tax=Streptomyces netropsis TaxID=55404 RepID=A0A7W7LG34_STRNE|nr:hypothetical protein [Streptomyces netropsis]MBB4889527.1 hypothetical protein [Streptomyces netropsis]GGR52992.1 hypothetical protein GCM10010219_67520 [Streptomyces netropsis]
MPQTRHLPVNARRALVAVAPPLLAAVVVLSVFLSLRDRLPGRMATHIGPGGEADGFSGQGAFLAVALAVLLGDAVLFGGLTHWIRTTPGVQRVIAVTGGAAAVLTGWLVVAVLLANADADNAASVTLPGLQAVLAFGAAAAYATVGWFACGRVEESETVAGPSVGTALLPLGDAETASWSRVTGSRVLPLTGMLVLTAGLVVGITTGWLPAVPLLVTGVPLALLTGARITADRRGITVTPTLAPWPRLNVPLERIAEAGHRPVNPVRDFGGWGYRARPGASGIVLRSGDALSARLTTGSEFVVTVDDAATAAALLNALADRERRSPAGG